MNSLWQDPVLNLPACPCRHKPVHIEAYLEAVRLTFEDIGRWLADAGDDEKKLIVQLRGRIAGPPAVQKRLVR